MAFETAIRKHNLLLTEAAVVESLRRNNEIELHPRLEHALLIYQEKGRFALEALFDRFIQTAADADTPILICTPTWRANRERIKEAGIEKNLNGDAARYLLTLREKWSERTGNIFVGGLIGCKNDCYRPDDGLDQKDAFRFHAWQVERLANEKIDFLMAATLPSVPEAVGIALAMQTSELPYIISFVINKHGRVLDGSSLEAAFGKIDTICHRPPIGYMINCAYPSFLNAPQQPEPAISRLIGIQGNASSLDHADLDGAAVLQQDSINDWGNRMVALNRDYGLKILGGCCGTNEAHLRYIVDHVDKRIRRF